MIRFTFDVAREQHRFIKHFVYDSDSTASAVTRALWELVAEDNALAQRVRSRVGIDNTGGP